MRLVSLILLSFLSSSVFPQERIEPVLQELNGTNYYSVKNDSAKKLLIFLHGGINNPYFDQDTSQIEFDYLFEGNLSFVKQSLASGYDLIVPIANDSFNWLEKPKTSFTILKELIEYSQVDYEEIYISGFSDGGTGSYKIFYTQPDLFKGLIVFNGYPQHANFYKSVSYDSVIDKKVLFFSTFKDKVIPYEFLITEYCQQKKISPNTFLYLTKGEHSFGSYNDEDFREVFSILNNENVNSETNPIQGFIRNDKLVRLYQFRKKIVRKYNFGKETYQENRKQHREK